MKNSRANASFGYCCFDSNWIQTISVVAIDCTVGAGTSATEDCCIEKDNNKQQ